MVPPTCIALIGDRFPAPRKPMSIAVITIQPGVSIALGVSLAAVLGDFAGWRTPFLVLGGALVSQFGFGALSWLLVGAAVGSGCLMGFAVNDKAVARARAHFAEPPR
jgi:hypothetical protein